MICFRLLNSKDPQQELINAVSSVKSERIESNTYTIDPKSFGVLPNASFSYWAGNKILSIFKNTQAFETTKRKALVGIQTNDDPRFVRLYWEITQSNCFDSKTWYYILKGDSASRFYDDVNMVVNYLSDGEEIKAWVASKYTSWSKHIQNTDYYFDCGFSWAKRTDFFMPSCVPSGCIPSVSRYLAVSEKNDTRWLVALGNSTIFDYLFKLCLEKGKQPNFITGILNNIPLQNPSERVKNNLNCHTNSAWSLKREIVTACQTSHAFYAPALAPSRAYSTTDSK
jgi:hypothetical protein